jgi:hypothetical protein
MLQKGSGGSGQEDDLGVPSAAVFLLNLTPVGLSTPFFWWKM